MATITGRLTLSGTGTTSDVLSIIKDKALTVASPSVQVGTIVLTTSFATSLDALNGTANTADTYLYVSNTSAGTETIEMQSVATATAATKTAATATCGSGDATVTQGVLTQGVLTQGKGVHLLPGEFAFIPLKALSHIQFKGSATTAILEYGYWTRSV